MPIVLDADQHLFEPRGLWSDYADPSRRSLAIQMEDDAKGHTHVVWNGRRIGLAHVTVPGETDADFRQTKALLRQGPFDYVEVYAFTARPGTRAAQLPNPVPDATITRRYRALLLCSLVTVPLRNRLRRVWRPGKGRGERHTPRAPADRLDRTLTAGS